LQEVANGWLAEEPHPDLGKQFIAKRFPIQQKEKTRLIDDFSICGVNSAFGMSEKLRVDAIDWRKPYDVGRKKNEGGRHR